MNEPTPNQTRLLGATAIGVILFWSVVFVYAVHGAMPTNPIRLPFEKAFRLRVILPEGWAFFTRAAREPRILMYVPAGDGWTRTSLGPTSEPRNAFGLDRGARAQGIEAGILVTSPLRRDWRECKGKAPEACLASAPVALEIDNPSPRPTLCGDVAFAYQPPVPWAWSKSAHKINMPSKVIRMRTRC